MTEFSIVMPVYNVAPYLRECLDSVLAQTYTDWEAICVDDGSTDGSGIILDEYAVRDMRFVVIHQANAGVSTARNVGIARSSGTWLSFIDSDDIVPVDYLQSFHESTRKADINFFPFARFPAKACVQPFFLPPVFVDRPELIAHAIHQMVFNGRDNLFGYTFDKFIRTSTVKKFNVRFHEGFCDAEDEIFAFDLCKYVSSLQIMSGPVYKYRVRETGLTHTAHRDPGRGVKWLTEDGDADPRFEYKVAAYSRSCVKLFFWFFQSPSLALCRRVATYIVRHRQWLTPNDKCCQSLKVKTSLGVLVFEFYLIITLIRNRRCRNAI